MNVYLETEKVRRYFSKIGFVFEAINAKISSLEDVESVSDKINVYDSIVEGCSTIEDLMDLLMDDYADLCYHLKRETGQSCEEVEV